MPVMPRRTSGTRSTPITGTEAFQVFVPVRTGVHGIGALAVPPRLTPISAPARATP